MFTGTLSVSRKKMIDEAKDLGARVLKSVSGKLDFLVVGEDAGQSKITKAKKLNIKMITEEEYKKKLKTGRYFPLHSKWRGFFANRKNLSETFSKIPL